MNKKTLLLFLLVLLILPAIAFGVDFKEMANNIAKTFLQITDAVVVIGWIFTGYIALTTGGEPAKVNLAKTAVITMIFGTAILVILNSTAGMISFITKAFGLG